LTSALDGGVTTQKAVISRQDCCEHGETLGLYKRGSISLPLSKCKVLKKDHAECS